MIGRVLVATSGALALAGCGFSMSSLRDDAPGERWEIAIPAVKAAGDDTSDLNAIRATAEGTIHAPPEGAKPQGAKPQGAKPQGTKPGPVAMECVFHDGILVAVNWIAGPEAEARH